MPTMAHQFMLAILYDLLIGFVKEKKLGFVLLAGLRVKAIAQHYREPDLGFLKIEFAETMGELCWEHADLVLEVVSLHDRRGDLHTKRREYARTGIPEYWIVDPQQQTTTVLTLGAKKKTYRVHGTFHRGERTGSICLPGFEVDVAEVLDQDPEKLRQSK